MFFLATHAISLFKNTKDKTVSLSTDVPADKQRRQMNTSCNGRCQWFYKTIVGVIALNIGHFSFTVRQTK